MRKILDFDRLFKCCNDCGKWLLGRGTKQTGYKDSSLKKYTWFRCVDCDQHYDND